MEKYKRVSYEIRCQISALLKIDISVPTIAKILGFNKSTIYREIKRKVIGVDIIQKMHMIFLKGDLGPANEKIKSEMV